MRRRPFDHNRLKPQSPQPPSVQHALWSTRSVAAPSQVMHRTNSPLDPWPSAAASSTSCAVDSLPSYVIIPTKAARCASALYRALTWSWVLSQEKHRQPSPPLCWHVVVRSVRNFAWVGQHVISMMTSAVEGKWAFITLHTSLPVQCVKIMHPDVYYFRPIRTRCTSLVFGLIAPRHLHASPMSLMQPSFNESGGGKGMAPTAAHPCTTGPVALGFEVHIAVLQGPGDAAVGSAGLKNADFASHTHLVAHRDRCVDSYSRGARSTWFWWQTCCAAVLLCEQWWCSSRRRCLRSRCLRSRFCR